VLYGTVPYRQNKREGVTVYYGSNGVEFARCEYRADKPWNGRLIQRHGFAPVLWDVSYRDGLLSGTEIQFESNGATNRLRTFNAGVEHGVQRQYYLGVLRSEEMLDSGRRVSHRSWYPNGQLEWDETYDELGRQHGTRRHWDTNGVLLATERYEHGREIRER
jgi:antitoxin component YwqK of YwqJK toxin-antitoxin module